MTFDQLQKVNRQRLAAALFLLESRAADRHGRKLNQNGWWANIASMPTCKTCGHILCEGHK